MTKSIAFFLVVITLVSLLSACNHSPKKEIETADTETQTDVLDSTETEEESVAEIPDAETLYAMAKEKMNSVDSFSCRIVALTECKSDKGVVFGTFTGLLYRVPFESKSDYYDISSVTALIALGNKKINTRTKFGYYQGKAYLHVSDRENGTEEKVFSPMELEDYLDYKKAQYYIPSFVDSYSEARLEIGEMDKIYLYLTGYSQECIDEIARFYWGDEMKLDEKISDLTVKITLNQDYTIHCFDMNTSIEQPEWASPQKQFHVWYDFSYGKESPGSTKFFQDPDFIPVEDIRVPELTEHETETNAPQQ
jgi:hypothetical protein